MNTLGRKGTVGPDCRDLADRCALLAKRPIPGWRRVFACGVRQMKSLLALAAALAAALVLAAPAAQTQSFSLAAGMEP